MGCYRCCLCGNYRNKEKNVSLHRFPNDANLKPKWLNFCGLSIDTDTNNLRICGKHFKPNEFADPNPHHVRDIVRLKPNVVPSMLNYEHTKATETNIKDTTEENQVTVTPVLTHEPAPLIMMTVNQTPQQIDLQPNHNKTEEICRTCLCTGNSVSLLTKDHLRLLRKTTKIEIKIDDKKHICDLCLKSLLFSNLFIDEFGVSNEYLNNLLLNSSNTDVDHTYSNLNLKIDDIENVFGRSCRVCLGMGEMQPIINYAEHFTKIANINFSAEDKLPKQICRKCLDRLEKTLLFIEKCQVTEEILKETVSDKIEDYPLLDFDEKSTQTMITMRDLDLKLPNSLKRESKTNEDFTVTTEIIELDDSQNVDEPLDDNIGSDVDLVRSQNKITNNKKKVKVNKERPIVLSNEETEQILEDISNIDNISNVDILSDKDDECDVFKCKICGLVSETFTKLWLHTKSHVFTCKNCSMQFQKYILYKTHVDFCSGKFAISGNYTCYDCGDMFKTEADLRFHKEEIAARLPKLCPHCGIYVLNKSQTNHMKSHKPNSGQSNSKNKPNPILPSQCHLCGKSVSALTSHLKRHAGIKPPPKMCNICGKMVSSNRYTYHLRIHNGESPYECKICDKRFVHYSTYKTHILGHTGEKKHACDLCDKRFALKKYLNLHRVTHFDRCFVCDICARTFKNEQNFKMHQRNHRLGRLDDLTGTLRGGTRKSAPDYKCKYCGSVFRMRKTLNQHLIENHTGKRLHECDICLKRFKQSAHLRTHVYLVHIKEKPFKCELCGKPFALKSGLTAHVKLRHEGLTRYNCTICSKGFYYPNKLRKHMTTAHTLEA